jgi:3-phenylpropionate/cinnamic acid dioxygenase small subunit
MTDAIDAVDVPALEAILQDTLKSTYIDDAYYARMRHDLLEWNLRGNPLTETERVEFEGQILHENWLLDRRAFEEWYGLYSRECVYWVPQAQDMPDVERGDPQTHVTIVCDDRRRLGDRIVWLRTGVAYSQLPPSFTSHVSSGFVRIPSDDPGETKIRSALLVHEVRSGHPVQTIAGWVGHVFVREDGAVKIARKVICLLDGARSHHNLTFLL